MAIAAETYTERAGWEATAYPDFVVEYNDSAHRYAIWRDGVRSHATSVTAALKVLDRPALVHWAQRVGAEGAFTLARQGELDGCPVEDVVERLRLFHLDVQSRKQEGADRGTLVHMVLQAWSSEGKVPDVRDFETGHRGYIQGLCRWLLEADPTPIAVEQVIASPAHGFAGRADLVAEINGLPLLVDLKTNVSGRTYDSHHLQTAGYRLALEECGINTTGGLVVAVGEEGSFEQAVCLAGPDDFVAVLAAYRAVSRIRAAQAATRRAS